MMSEFRELAVKGNALDLAVGIVIGAAFDKIVNSLVNDLTSGETDFESRKTLTSRAGCCDYVY